MKTLGQILQGVCNTVCSMVSPKLFAFVIFISFFGHIYDFALISLLLGCDLTGDWSIPGEFGGNAHSGTK